MKIKKTQEHTRKIMKAREMNREAVQQELIEDRVRAEEIIKRQLEAYRQKKLAEI